MFQALRRRLRVSPASVIASLALVFAMTGGAYAAGRYVITSTKQISPKVLKSLKGSSGKNGAQGPTGTAGAPGATGPAGPAGPTGPAGPGGAQGPQGPQGPVGAAGVEGKEGKTGFAEILPSGKTLTGQFSASAFTEEAGLSGTFATTAVNFPFRVENELKEGPIPHFIKAGATSLPLGCTGSVAEPGAEEGNLCVFATQETNVEEGELGHLICDLTTNECTSIGLTRINPDGFVIKSIPKEGGTSGHGQSVIINGTWAVTAE